MLLCCVLAVYNILFKISNKGRLKMSRLTKRPFTAVRRCASLLTALFILFSFCLPSVQAADTIFAAKAGAVSTSSEDNERIAVFISIYNDVLHEFYLSNTKIELSAGASEKDALSALKESGTISEYTLTDGVTTSITSITLNDGTELKTMPPPDSQVFYFKQNGVVKSTQENNLTLQEGDILEVIYGEKIKTVVIPTESGGEAEAVASASPVVWDEALQEILSESCDYLNLVAEADVSYLVALGCAGRSPDLVKLNSALGAARRASQDNSPQSLASAVLAMTFTGYDASKQITKLADTPLDDKIDIAIAILFAYNSYSYELNEDAQNTEEGLVNYILSLQAEDGSFSSVEAGQKISTTSQIISLLSHYRGISGVTQAIDKAVSYLADQYSEKASFKSTDKGDSRLISQVMTALISAGLGIYDERFMTDKETLLDLLLGYKNQDGGFSIEAGGISDVDSSIKAVIAMSAAKKNKYPYTVTQNLAPPTEMTSAQELVNKMKNLSIEELVLVCIVIVTVLSVIIISFVFRYSRKKPLIPSKTE